MQLTNDASKAGRMWSVRLSVLAGILGAVEATLPLWSSTLPTGTFAALSSVVAIAAAIARVIKQERLHE